MLLRSILHAVDTGVRYTAGNECVTGVSVCPLRRLGDKK